MYKLATIILFFSPYLIYSQQSSNKNSDSLKINQQINMQEGIEKLLQKNHKKNYEKLGIKGFCVQIYSGESREKAQTIKYQFMKNFNDIASIEYIRISPNWKVRVGKYRTKLEAKKLQSIIQEKYPGAYITELIVPFGEFD